MLEIETPHWDGERWRFTRIRWRLGKGEVRPGWDVIGERDAPPWPPQQATPDVGDVGADVGRGDRS